MCGSVFAIKTANRHKIMGVPICMVGERYRENRNALFFNLAFAFDCSTRPKLADRDSYYYDITEREDSQECDSSMRLAMYEPILRKLASCLETLERESNLLISEETKLRVQEMVKKIYYDLNEKGETSINVDRANTINLKLYPILYSPPSVEDHQVPVRIVPNLEKFISSEWDLAAQKILPHIDGVAYIRRIAEKADCSVDLVRKCVQHLVYYQAVTLIDIFQYSNMYAATSNIRTLAANPTMQNHCLKVITLPGHEPPPFYKVLALYCSLQPGVTVRDFCLDPANDLDNLHIDERLFITYGLVNSFLRRIHTYVILNQSVEPEGHHRFSPETRGTGHFMCCYFAHDMHQSCSMETTLLMRYVVS